MEGIQVQAFSEASDLVDYLLNEPLFRARNRFEATTKGRRGFIFRGQANAHWPLLPTAHREGAELRHFTPQAPPVARGAPPKLAAKTSWTNFTIATQLHAELRSILLFLEAVDVAMAPRHNNANLRAQQGLFTYIPSANAFFRRRSRWPTLQDLLGSATSALRLLTLPASRRIDLLRLLWHHDVTTHHLTPSLATAARSVSYTLSLFG